MQVFPHPDKFGYYQIGDRKTYSKIEALEWQRSSGHFPEWYFNRQVFDHMDWFIEPSVDLWTMYQARARQIRETYDYCVIFYSGGSDSHNLLSAWLDAGCKVDEIATFHYYAGSNNQQSFMNAEVTNVAIPTAQTLAKQYEFKHRLIDISQDIVDLVNTNWLDYKYLITNCVSPNNHAKINWRRDIKDYADMIAIGKRVCFIWGSEKPQIFYDGRFYTQFFDVIDNCVGPYAQNNFVNGYYDELFYWTPDFSEIVCKQAHVIKRFCESINDPQYYQSSPTRFGYNTVLKKYLTADAVKQVIYPKWDPGTFCDGKTRSIIWSDRDHWFIHGNIGETAKFRQLSKSLMQDIDPYWLNDPTDPLKGIKAHASQKYYLSR
jgi:hypothetical protein